MKTNALRASEAEPEEALLPFPSVSRLHLRKILLATDFSASSQKALGYAVSLAKELKAEVVVLHVLEPAPPQVAILEAALMDTSLREEMAKQLDDLRGQVAEEIKVSAVLREGTSTHKQIVAFAGEVQADLLIIGNHGRNALGRAFMGSTAEKVIRHAGCPVLVIREREHDFISGRE
jgi:universal stress protein A